MGLDVALKVVRVPEESTPPGAGVRAADDAAQRLQQVTPHPGLLPPVACAAVKNDADGLR